MADDDLVGFPLPEEYGRVTNPERFAVLHELANRLLKDLASEYDVVFANGLNLSDLQLPARAVSQAVRLVPAGDESSPLMCLFTDFPGLLIRAGGGFERAYPSCGCDACNEDPLVLGDELTAALSLVVGGHFWESVEGAIYSYGLGGDRGTRLIGDDDRRRSLPSHRHWEAWTARTRA